ncbi:hypothetical protein EAJSRFBN_CDS0213 [Salmonella phage SeKF_19]
MICMRGSLITVVCPDYYIRTSIIELKANKIGA